SMAGAAGDMVSTTRDMNRFMDELINGDLLAPEQLAEMQTTVPLPEGYPGDGYGLGLIQTDLSCGEVSWGHGGDIPVFATRGGVTESGKAVTLALTALPLDLPEVDRQEAWVDLALCS